MSALVKQICALSVLCGAGIMLAPEGSIKRLMNVLCSVVLMAALVFGIKDLDFEMYSMELAKYRQTESEFLENTEDSYNRLSRSVIEQQYAAYILDKAKSLNMGEARIKVSAQWSTEGLWIPYSFETNSEYCSELAEYIEAELGIPVQRQQWNKNE